MQYERVSFDVVACYVQTKKIRPRRRWWGLGGEGEKRKRKKNSKQTHTRTQKLPFLRPFQDGIAGRNNSNWIFSEQNYFTRVCRVPFTSATLKPANIRYVYRCVAVFDVRVCVLCRSLLGKSKNCCFAVNSSIHLKSHERRGAAPPRHCSRIHFWFL